MRLSEFRLNKELKRKILLTLLDKRPPNGVSCCFISIDTKVGMKLFPSCKDRNFALKRQKELAIKKLAPRAGRSFTFTFMWPYKEENRDNEDWGFLFEPLKLYGFFTQEAKTNFKYKESYIDDMETKLCKAGIDYSDVHGENIGFIGKRLVIIDTDPVSFGISS
jgi:hypothetical protein